MLETLLATERPGETTGETSLEPGNPALWRDLTVLDLYAGTGALGIEALSRGATWCDFVESDRAARRVIERNLAATGLADRARVLGLTAEKVVSGTLLAPLHAPYDLVLMDPPYADRSVATVIGELAAGGLLRLAALVAVEHSRRLALPGSVDSLIIVRERRYGDTVLSIYRRSARRHDVAEIPGASSDA